MSTSEESRPQIKQEPERRTPVSSENTKSTQESAAPTTATSSTSTSAINLKDAKVRSILSSQFLAAQVYSTVCRPGAHQLCPPASRSAHMQFLLPMTPISLFDHFKTRKCLAYSKTKKLFK